MSGYRCFLMSGDKIQAVQTYECADDAEVILKARALLDSKPAHPSIDVWEGKRLVARHARDPSGKSLKQENANIVQVVKRKDD